MTNSRKQCRAGHRCEPQSFVEAVECLAHHSDLPLAQIAERMGKSANYLRKATSQYDGSHPFRADLILPMTLITGNLVVVDYIAAACGGSFVFQPKAAPTTDDVRRELVDVPVATGALFAYLQEALSDGRIEAHEAPKVQRLVEHAEKELADVGAVAAAAVTTDPIRAVR